MLKPVRELLGYVWCNEFVRLVANNCIGNDELFMGFVL